MSDNQVIIFNVAMKNEKRGHRKKVHSTSRTCPDFYLEGGVKRKMGSLKNKKKVIKHI
jgi:hypothetical protein